jgi:GNAT superfamily N-acetyltransferase
MVSIEPVIPDDRADWLDLWNGYLAFYETELDDVTTNETFARLTQPGSGPHGAIARDAAGRPLGLVHWLTHPGTWTTSEHCYLEDLFVSADARGTGTGRALVAHVRNWAENHGSAKVYWLTAETNATARALYDQVATRTGFIHYEIDL